jgi:hypothetical protein
VSSGAKNCPLTQGVPAALRASGTARVELKSPNGKKLSPGALIRAGEQSVRAEIRPPASSREGFSSARAVSLIEVKSMKNDIKSLSLNIIAGFLTYYVTKYLDTNNLPTLSYLVFALYLLFIFSAFYFHFQQRPKPQGNLLKQNTEEEPKQNKQDSKPKLFHDILQTVVKLASQHVNSSATAIGKIINENPDIVLSYLKQMEIDSLVVYESKGNPPDLNTSFFIAYHENPWKYVKIQSS